MHFRGLCWGWVVALGFGMASGCQVGFAQEPEAPASSESPAASVVPAPSTTAAATTDEGENPAPVRMHKDRQAMGTDRWENALDAKLTSLFDRKASNTTSPTIMLTAIWNRKFSTNSYVGLTVSGLPQSYAEKKDDVKTSYTMYYGGLSLAQGLYEYKPFRAIFELALGRGLTFVRVKADGQESEAHSTKFNFYEPGLVVMVYEWNHLEMGFVGTNRIAKIDRQDEGNGIEDKDVSSVSYGLTFRTERW